MKHGKLVDLVLEELQITRQLSSSVKRILVKHKVDFDDSLITEIENTLLSKSLVEIKKIDSKGNNSYALSDTGKDFIRSFGSYSKYERGLKIEKKLVEKARSKKPFETKPGDSRVSVSPYHPRERTFIEKNMVALLILVLVVASFLMIYNVT